MGRGHLPGPSVRPGLSHCALLPQSTVVFEDAQSSALNTGVTFFLHINNYSIPCLCCHAFCPLPPFSLILSAKRPRSNQCRVTPYAEGRGKADKTQQLSNYPHLTSDPHHVGIVDTCGVKQHESSHFNRCGREERGKGSEWWKERRKKIFPCLSTCFGLPSFPSAGWGLQCPTQNNKFTSC